jgi:two-component system, OmpR family, KDP operon response regulator KdpE
MSKKELKFLVVDSDSKHINLMRYIFKSENIPILAVRSGEKAVEIVARENPDLIFLETKLDGEIDGFTVARRVRDFSDIPIVFVSNSIEPEDILRAFKVGADDFISKPIHGSILVARIWAVMNRYQKNIKVPCEKEITCGVLKIDIPCRQVTLEGVEVYLTETEFNLLLELAKNQGQVLLHEQLLTAVWGEKNRNDVDYLRSYIHILRRKLESKPQNPKLILSKPGVGYMLVSGPTNDPGD